MPCSRRLLVRLFVLLTMAGALPVLAQSEAKAQGRSGEETVLIGDLTTVERIGEPALSYQRGRDLAADYIAMAGGVMGNKRIEIVSIDPGGDPSAAARAAEDLRKRGAVLFLGGLLSDTTLAVARAVGDIPVLAADARLPAAVVSDVPNLYQIGPSAEVLGRVLAAQAAETPAVRWGVVARDDYFGRALAHAFWNALRARRPEIELAVEKYVPTLSGDVAPALAAVANSEAEGLLVGLRDGDLVAFVRSARGTGILDRLTVAVPHMGSPEILGALGADLPDGWLTTGYVCCTTGGQPHRAFAEAYQKADPQGRTPTLGALYGYVAMTTAATAIDSAWSEKPARIAEALADLTLSTPLGEMRFAPDTHQANLPLWSGRTGGGQFLDARPVDPLGLGRP
ncbi:ABC transporter substrate-binding protein [Roseospira marina]|nr:ABC transporter substrate-binding protein [Roseospira marina]MBB4314470.1 branched-chain amino acid transport system substrate-binding protein [Roseospira marina]MBB5087630.1 branched-chain amino acid transport system substrate-binding protein [Roseospira marina]